jgi:hypothetical protein
MIPLGVGRDGERSRARAVGLVTRAPTAAGATPPRSWRRAGAGLVLAAAVQLAAGCTGTGQPAATAPSPASSAAPAQAVRPAQAVSPAQRKAAARSYLAIARPANRRLETDFDGLDDHRGDLAAARADLRDAAATERQFDRRLLALKLPAATETVARLLVTANEARARLTTAAAASTSLSQLHRYEPRLTAANQPVEEAVRVIRSQLGLPPPETS